MSNHVVSRQSIRPNWPHGRASLAPAGEAKGWCDVCGRWVYAMEGGSASDRGAWSTKAGQLDCVPPPPRPAGGGGYEVLDD